MTLRACAIVRLAIAIHDVIHDEIDDNLLGAVGAAVILPRRFDTHAADIINIIDTTRLKKAFRIQPGNLSPIPIPIIKPFISYLFRVRGGAVRMGAGTAVGESVGPRSIVVSNVKHVTLPNVLDEVVEQNSTTFQKHVGEKREGKREGGGRRDGAVGLAVVMMATASAMTTIPTTIRDARVARELNALHGLSPDHTCPRGILHGALLTLRVPPLPPMASGIVAASAGGGGRRGLPLLLSSSPLPTSSPAP